MKWFDKISEVIMTKCFPFGIFILGGGGLAWFTIKAGLLFGISLWFLVPMAILFILIFAQIGRIAYLDPTENEHKGGKAK